MIWRTISFATFFCFSCCLFAQKGDNGVVSFTMVAPETAEQGKPFSICYRLVARHWDKWEMPKSTCGFVLSDVNYTIATNDGIHTMEIKATAFTSKTGDMELPRIAIPVGGKMVYADGKHILVTPSSICGDEMTAAQQWLVGQGCHPDSVTLFAEHRNQAITLFSDKTHEKFAVVANKQYWPLLGNPILAFSVDNLFVVRGNGRQDYADILEPFSNQIEALSQSGNVHSVPFGDKEERSVLPILGDRRWGQHAPYNLLAPSVKNDGQKTIIGCLPLALSMVMSAHQWPLRGQSNVCYQSGGSFHQVDFSAVCPQWERYKDRYEKSDTTGEIKSLSHLLVSIGKAIDASFNSKATSAALNRAKHVLCNNLCYSGKTTLLNELSAQQLTFILRQELDAGRPCIVASDAHAFVCDGYKQDFFHFNMGWYGQCNGYYRLALGDFVPPSGKNFLWLKTIIFGIEPNFSPTIKEITTSESGSLEELLSQEEKENTTMLRVSGPLNTTDILLLRKMAGATEEPFDILSWRGGALRYLDLTNASIVSDRQPYYSRPASETWTHVEKTGRQQKKTTYDFKTMTEEQWQRFKEEIGENQPGLSYSRTDDNRYSVHYHCSDSIIGKYMFAGCSSLNAIRLPADTKKIDDYAFLECLSLQQISIPPSVQKLGAVPFCYCPSLERIELPQNCTTDKKGIAKNCSPVLQTIRVSSSPE